MPGAPKKERTLATISQDVQPTEETKELFDEATGRLHSLEHTDLERDSAHRELKAEIDRLSKRGKTEYTAEDKMKAALAYEVSKSSADAGRLTGLPDKTIRRWKATAPWWPRAIEIAQMVQREGTDAMYQKIQDKANTALLDRIEGGDYIISAKGETLRRPISGKDLMTISAIARDKQSILRGQPTNITEKISDGDRLEALANRITKAVQESGKVIEGVVIRDDE